MIGYFRVKFLESKGNLYPVHVVIWVAFTPPLAGVAAVPSAIRFLQTEIETVGVATPNKTEVIRVPLFTK